MKLACIGVGARGRGAYLENMKPYDDVEITALCDRNADALKAAQSEVAPGAACFENEEAFWKAGKLADWLVIATLDKDHYRHIMCALELGYHVMVEKPVTESAEELDAIIALSKEKDCMVLVGHVLRYTAYFGKIKQLIADGQIGDIVTVNHEESVGYWHFAHSYVRGNWRNTTVGAPLLLAKNCHDFDLLYWFIGKECLSVTSHGGLHEFKACKAPAGATSYCMGGCTAKADCLYDAEKLYLEPGGVKDVFDFAAGLGEQALLQWWWPLVTGTPNPTRQQVEEALKTSNYGRCVYHSDNNTNDHQIVSMLFEDGITVNFTVSAFTRAFSRRIHITGTRGEIIGTDDEFTFVVNRFGQGSETVKVDASMDGHGGGDAGICDTLHKIMLGQPVEESRLTTIDVTAKSHRIAYAALESEKTGKTVVLAN